MTDLEARPQLLRQAKEHAYWLRQNGWPETAQNLMDLVDEVLSLRACAVPPPDDLDVPQDDLRVGVPPAASSSAACASRSLFGAFEAGWRAAAEWTNRDDLLSDIGSPAYNEDRERFLNGDCAATRVPGQAEHGPAWIAQTGYASSARREPEPGGSECGDGRHAVARQHGSSAPSARPETPSDAGNSRSLSGSSEVVAEVRNGHLCWSKSGPGFPDGTKLCVVSP